MNLSITRVVVLILGIVLLIAGVLAGVDAINATDWVKGIFAIIGIAIGLALVSGKGINLSA